MKTIEVYTDGAYSPLRDQGGIGVVILEDNQPLTEYSNMYKNCTNNKMELGALIVAMRLLLIKKYSVDKLVIYTDSQYCIGCATLGWQRKKNATMWLEFDKQLKLVKENICSDIEFKHVKGHADSHWNNYVDKLAQSASKWIKTK